MPEPIRKAVFPVAGLGTRFLPATKALPKEMLTVVDRPVISPVTLPGTQGGVKSFPICVLMRFAPRRVTRH